MSVPAPSHTPARRHRPAYLGALCVSAGLVLGVLVYVARLPQPVPAPVPPPAPLPTTRLLLGGDVMLSRHVGRLARRHADPAWPFRLIAPRLAAADLTFVNLESPFAGKGRVVEKGMVFKAEPAMIEGLQLAGVDIVSTANNHARDQGVAGLDYTWSWLRQHGIVSVGAGPDGAAAHAGAVLERNGVRFGFLAYTYDQSNGNRVVQPERVAELDASQMQADVARLRQHADVVLVSMHAGIEYAPRPNAQQRTFARAAIDAGADVVIGHHPHVVQPVEEYRGGLILYSLGNFVFDQFHRTETQKGLLAEVTYRGKRRVGQSLLPVDLRQAVPVLRPPS